MPHTCTNGTPVEKTIKQQATLSNFETHLRPGQGGIGSLFLQQKWLSQQSASGNPAQYQCKLHGDW